jgi:hypothetical protein
MTTQTHAQMRLDEIWLLGTILEKIWRLGDHDEMSIKHIGHGLAALVSGKDWQDALDYDLPNEEITDKQLEKLKAYWLDVKQLIHGVTRAELIGVFKYLPIAVYGAVYLDTFSDYYKEPATL